MFGGSSSWVGLAIVGARRRHRPERMTGPGRWGVRVRRAAHGRLRDRGPDLGLDRGVLVSRRPQNAVGWLMVLDRSRLLAVAADGLPDLRIHRRTHGQADRLAQVAGWITVLLQLVAILQIAIGFLFPTGDPGPTDGAGSCGRLGRSSIVFVVISLTRPDPCGSFPASQPVRHRAGARRTADAPILAPSPDDRLAGLGVSMISRYRYAGGIEGQQMKWFVLGLECFSGRARASAAGDHRHQ